MGLISEKKTKGKKRVTLTFINGNSALISQSTENNFIMLAMLQKVATERSFLAP
jgi:hypothetical protein